MYLSDYDVEPDYCEMVVEYGYTTLFLSAMPLMATFAWMQAPFLWAAAPAP